MPSATRTRQATDEWIWTDISLRLVPDDAVLHRLLRKVQVFTLAESSGGVESLIDHPATNDSCQYPGRKAEQMSIGPDIIRISVGLGDVNDLQSDLEQALAC